ncbi:MAG: hypothetical protein GY799_21070 [Desulfobulbaceae bacterium]|nr:hypothetical protein [Desulfobulbaceae bacterium]
MKFANLELEKVVVMAKEMGLKVWAFQKSPRKISQVFFDDGKTFGTASADFGTLNYGTCHKANRRTGTGYRIGESNILASKEMVKATFSFAPSWAWSNDLRSIEKETFEEHTKSRSAMDYFEI